MINKENEKNLRPSNKKVSNLSPRWPINLKSNFVQPKVISHSTANLMLNKSGKSTSKTRKMAAQPIALNTWVNGAGGLA